MELRRTWLEVSITDMERLVHCPDTDALPAGVREVALLFQAEYKDLFEALDRFCSDNLLLNPNRFSNAPEDYQENLEYTSSTSNTYSQFISYSEHVLKIEKYRFVKLLEQSDFQEYITNRFEGISVASIEPSVNHLSRYDTFEYFVGFRLKQWIWADFRGEYHISELDTEHRSTHYSLNAIAPKAMPT